MSTATTTPTVTLIPLPGGWTYRGDINEPAHRPAVWMYVVLDVPTRTLSISDRLDSEGVAGAPAHYNWSIRLPAPGGRTVSFDLLGAPSRIGFMLKVLRTADAINTFLVEVARPLAEEILANMIPVPDTDGEYDWTAAGLAAAAELDFACDYPFGVPVYNSEGQTTAQQRAKIRADRSRGLVDATTLLQIRPDLIEKAWAGMDDEHLNQRADDLTRFLIGWRVDRGEPIYQQLGIERRPDGQWPWVRLVGARAFMYGYRRRVAGNLTVQSADRWYHQPEYAAQIHAGLTDAEVAALADRHTAAARCDGLLLVGAADAIRGRRDEARQRVRDQFPAARDAYAAARAAFEAASQHRSALLAQVMSWGLASDTDAALEKLSGMSHTGVGKLRRRLADLDDALGGDE